MRDPQMEVNKRRSQVLHILNQSAKSGWYGPEGAFQDRVQWEDDSPKAGAILEYKVNPVSPDGGKPQQILPQPLPGAFVELEKLAAVDLRDVSGVNIELMGLSTKDTPGVVTGQRQKQALTILQCHFDGLKRATKLLGRMLLSMMQQYYEGRVFQIIGKQGTEEMAQLGGEMMIGRYDLVAEESPYSPTQRMETGMKLQAIVQMALQAHIPVPPDVLDYMDLPLSLTNKWKQMIATQMEQAEKNPLERVKQYVDIDRLFPLLTPMEQGQVLQAMGIQPDAKGRMIQAAGMVPPPPGMGQQQGQGQQPPASGNSGSAGRMPPGMVMQ